MVPSTYLRGANKGTAVTTKEVLGSSTVLCLSSVVPKMVEGPGSRVGAATIGA